VTAWRCLRCGASGRGDAPEVCPECGTGKEASIVEESSGSRPALDKAEMKGVILPKDDPRRAALLVRRLIDQARGDASSR
jgi:hypothetical protein